VGCGIAVSRRDTLAAWCCIRDDCDVALGHEDAIDIAVEHWACERAGSAGCGVVCEYDDWAGVEVGGRFWVQGGRRRGDVGLHAWKRRTAGRCGDRVERDTGPPVLPRAACG